MAAPTLHYLAHTADVGFDITADTLPELFDTAARGMFELLLGKQQLRSAHASTDRATRPLQLHASEPALLLAAWLRELLFLFETEDLCAVHADFQTLTAHDLQAAVTFTHSRTTPLREIKAVTYHQLAVHQNHAWHARVVFDV